MAEETRDEILSSIKTVMEELEKIKLRMESPDVTDSNLQITTELLHLVRDKITAIGDITSQKQAMSNKHFRDTLAAIMDMNNKP